MSSLKAIYESPAMVSYYDFLTKSVQLLASEEIIFKKYLNENDRILDVGCGTGRTTILLFNQGFREIVGVDISENMIAQARKNNSEIPFTAKDIIDFEPGDELFDVAIFSFNGLMLIKTYQQRVQICLKINALLKRGGHFIFTTPYLDNKLHKESWQTRLRQFSHYDNWEFGDIYLEDQGVQDIYIHMPLKSEIYRLMKASNFSVKESVRRLDICQEVDAVEEHLDDNMYWVVEKV